MGDGGGAAAAGAGPGFEKFRREVRILFPSSPGPWHAHAHLRLDWARGWTLGGRRGQRGRERGAAAEVAPRGARSLAAASRIRCHFVCCGPAVGKWWWRSPGSWACLGGGCWSTACVESDVAVLELRGGQVGLGCGAIPIVWCPGLFLLADHCFFLLHAASLAHPCCVIAPRGRPALLCRLTRRPCAHCTHAPVPGFYRAD